MYCSYPHLIFEILTNMTDFGFVRCSSSHRFNYTAKREKQRDNCLQIAVVNVHVHLNRRMVGTVTIGHTH